MIWNKGSSQYPSMNRYYGVSEYMFVFSKGNPKTVHLIRDKVNRSAGQRKGPTSKERAKDGRLRVTNAGITGRVTPEYGVRTNVWDIPAESINRTGHPAIYPVRLAGDHIRTWSEPGDVVLDPFMGSGTTGVAAVKLKRDFIGIEICPEYYAAAKARIEHEQQRIGGAR